MRHAKLELSAKEREQTYGTKDLLRAAAKRTSDLSVETQTTHTSHVGELIESKLPWREVLARNQRDFHIHPIQQGESIPSSVAGMLLDKLVFDRFANDCQGAVSVTYDHQIYQLDALDSCHRIRHEITLTHLGGYSMRENTAMAVAYAREQCSKGSDLHFSDKDNASLDLPCSRMPALPSDLFVTDSDH